MNVWDECSRFKDEIMTMENIIFKKPVPFLFINKGDIFKVLRDADGRKYFVLRKRRYYLQRRDELDYYKYTDCCNCDKGFEENKR